MSSDTVMELVARRPPWLASPGEHDGIVVSSRIRLARNAAGWEFPRKLTRARQQELAETLLAAARRALGSGAHALRVDRLSEVERTALCERQLVSRELTAARHPTGLAVAGDESAALMVMEEDHLRLQVLRPGLDLDGACAAAVALDRTLAAEVGWTWHARLGWLTSCHTNVGTGMRASVMLHLPALAETGEIKQVLRGLAKLHLTVRGQHGEGTEPAGHLYQISNQRSLGMTEAALTTTIADAARQVVAAERVSREVLGDKRRTRLEDRIFRAWGLLTNARTLTSDELVEQVAWLRLGVALRVLAGPTWPVLDRLFVQCQPAHLQLQHAGADEVGERDQLRARLVREWLSPTPN